MNFELSQEQEEYRQRVIEFATRELQDEVVESDRDSRFAMEAWKRCGEFGFHSLSLPEKYTGKADTDFLTAIVAMEALGYACPDNGLAFALNAQIWTVQHPILKFGTDDQCERYLPRLGSGEWIGCHAVSEPTSGSDIFALQTVAAPADGGYILNGKKHYITLGPVADLALVFALTDPPAGKWGVSAFLVETSSAGVLVGPNQPKMGLRTVPFGELEFKDCFVPESNRLGPEGAGMSMSTSFLEKERCTILSSQVGSMQRQLEQTIEFAKDRTRFGKPIGKNQSVANRVVDMKMRLEMARLLLYKTASLIQAGQPAMLEAAMLKLFLGESFVQSSLDAIRVHGADGYISSFGIERDMRDAIGGTIAAGTSDIQRKIVAKLLGL